MAIYRAAPCSLILISTAALSQAALPLVDTGRSGTDKLKRGANLLLNFIQLYFMFVPQANMYSPRDRTWNNQLFLAFILF